MIFSKRLKMSAIMLAIALAGLTPAFVFAQDEDPEDLLFIDELIVTTATKQAQKVSEAPATIYVVTAEMIRKRGYSNLNELLTDIPEIEIQNKSVSEYANYVTMRGMAGNENFIILLDGFRINSPTGTPNVLGSNYALTNVQQVEVVLGPASALYGADAFGGIINIITQSGDKLNGGWIRSGVGRFQTFENTLVYGRELAKGISVSLSANVYHSAEPFFPDFYPQDFVWYTNYYKPYGQVLLSPFGPDTLTLAGGPMPYDTPTTAYFGHIRLNAGDFELGFSRNREAHSSSVGIKPEYSVYAKDAVIETIIESLYGRHVFEAESSKWSLQTSLWKGVYELMPRSMFRNTFDNYQNGYKYELGKNLKLEEQFTFHLNERTSLIGGFSYEDISALPKTGDLPQKFDPDQAPALQNQYYLGTNISDQNGDTLIIYQDFYHLNYHNYALYGQLQTELSSLVHATIGARYDENTRYGATFNPRLGIILSPHPRLMLKLLYGESYLAPSPYETYQHYGAFIPQTNDQGEIIGLSGPFWHLPNPDLKPEKLRSGETALNIRLSTHAAINLTGFYTQVEDLISFQPSPNTTFKGVPVTFAERPENSGKAAIQGGTCRLNYNGARGDWSGSADAAYSFVDGDIDGKALTYSARHTIKAGFELSCHRFALSSRLLYRSESYHQLYHRYQNNTFRNEPFTILNLNVRFDKLITMALLDVSVFLKITNLLDARYYNVSLATEEGFGQTPQDPRRINGGVMLAF